VNKDDLARALAGRTQLAIAEARTLLAALGDLAAAELTGGGTVVLPGIGELSVLDRSERRGHNPASGEPITIAARRAVRFRPMAALRRAVNGETGTSKAA
jgi:DNA-binding protein HU-beta